MSLFSLDNFSKHLSRSASCACELPACYILTATGLWKPRCGQPWVMKTLPSEIIPRTPNKTFLVYSTGDDILSKMYHSVTQQFSQCSAIFPRDTDTHDDKIW